MGCDVGPYFSLAIYNTLNEVRHICASGILGEKSTDQWDFYKSSQSYAVKSSGIKLSFTYYWSTHGDQLGQVVFDNDSDITHSYCIWSVTQREQLLTLTFHGQFVLS